MQRTLRRVVTHVFTLSRVKTHRSLYSVKGSATADGAFNDLEVVGVDYQRRVVYYVVLVIRAEY